MHMATVDSLLEKYGGDLNALVGKFESSGLGQKVESWVGTGENESISADQIKNALGSELDELAAKVGIGRDEAAEELAQDLPAAVDKATPTGSIPGAENVQQASTPTV
jgi:uncharacterized protein YidB (DUF937 family)